MTITTSYISGGIDVVSGPAPQNAAALVSGAAIATLPTITDNGSRTVVPAPSVAGNAPTLKGERLDLLRANAAVTAANEDARVASEPVSRLRALADGLSRAEQDLISRRSRYDGVVGEWISTGCRGDRPAVPPELVASERELAEKAADARAARSALPAAEVAAQAAAEHRNTLVQRQVAAHKAVVLQVVEEFVESQFLSALRVFRGCEARVAAVEQHFREIGDFTTAGQVREIAAKACKLVPDMGGDARAGTMIVARLRDNPSGNL